MKLQNTGRIGGALFAAALMLVAAPALAATYTVTDADGGTGVAGSLGYILANDAGPGDVIVFDPSVTLVEVTGRYNLLSEQVTIDGDLGGGNRVTFSRAASFTGSQMTYIGRGTTIRNVIFDTTGDTANDHALIGGSDADPANPTVFENCDFIMAAAGTNTRSIFLYNRGNCAELRFTNCYFESPGAPYHHSAIWCQGPYTSGPYTLGALTVDGCEFRGFDKFAIDMYNQTAGNENFVVEAITITDNVFEGVGQVDGADPSQAAAWLEAPKITGANDETVAIPITITGNKIFRMAYGIHFYHFIEGVTLQGNVIGPLEDGSAPTTDEDWLTGGVVLAAYNRDFTIGGSGAGEANTIQYCTTAAVWLGNNKDWGPADRIRVLENDIDHIDNYDPDTNTWAGTGEAIRIQTVDFNGNPRLTMRPSNPTIPFNNCGAEKPTIDTVSTTGLSGTAQPNQTIYVYWNPPLPVGPPYASEAGVVTANFIGTATADGSGNWSLNTDLSARTSDHLAAYAINPASGDRLTYPENTSEVTLRPFSGTLGDTDEDGLPDAWEILWGLDPNDASGANGPNGDPDADGFTNQEEYEAQPEDLGSDPLNALSTPLNPGPNGEPLPAAGLAGLALLASALAFTAIRRRK